MCWSLSCWTQPCPSFNCPAARLRWNLGLELVLPLYFIHFTIWCYHHHHAWQSLHCFNVLQTNFLTFCPNGSDFVSSDHQTFLWKTFVLWIAAGFSPAWRLEELLSCYSMSSMLDWLHCELGTLVFPQFPVQFEPWVIPEHLNQLPSIQGKHACSISVVNPMSAGKERLPAVVNMDLQQELNRPWPSRTLRTI